MHEARLNWEIQFQWVDLGRLKYSSNQDPKSPSQSLLTVSHVHGIFTYSGSRQAIWRSSPSATRVANSHPSRVPVFVIVILLGYAQQWESRQGLHTIRLQFNFAPIYLLNTQANDFLSPRHSQRDFPSVLCGGRALISSSGHINATDETDGALY